MMKGIGASLGIVIGKILLIENEKMVIEKQIV
jgi:phosphoenolpyruvate-protein kinase (PTS system EI component)